MDPTPPHTTSERHDRGFTLVEFVVIVAILAIIAVAVVFSVGSQNDRSDVAACSVDARTLARSADAYLTRERVEVLPAMGFSANRYELALIDAGLLEQVSTTYDLLADGTVTTNGRSCT